jgi:MarR family transcriptional regulator for hemolysin
MSLKRQATRLCAAFQGLMRCCRLRDRERIGGHELSPSQRDSLDAVDRLGPLAMRRLADHLHIDAGRMTRITNALVDAGLVVRLEDPKDRRVCCPRITGRGKARISEIHSDFTRECRQILMGIPTERRETVIASMTHLLSALHERLLQSPAQAPGGRRRNGGAGPSGTAV